MSATLYCHPMRNTLVRVHHVAQAQRFDVSVVRPDGQCERFEHQGNSFDASNEGMERAELGGVVRVRCIETEGA